MELGTHSGHQPTAEWHQQQRQVAWRQMAGGQREYVEGEYDAGSWPLGKAHRASPHTFLGTPLISMFRKHSCDALMARLKSCGRPDGEV